MKAQPLRFSSKTFCCNGRRGGRICTGVRKRSVCGFGETHARRCPSLVQTSLAGARRNLRHFFRLDPRSPRPAPWSALCRRSYASEPQKACKHAQKHANTRRPPKTHPTGPRGAPLHCRTLISPCHFTATGCPRGSTPPSRCELLHEPDAIPSPSPTRFTPRLIHQLHLHCSTALLLHFSAAGTHLAAEPLPLAVREAQHHLRGANCSTNLMPFPPRSQSKSPRTRPSTWHQQCISTAQLLCSCIFLAGDGQSADARTVPDAS